MTSYTVMEKKILKVDTGKRQISASINRVNLYHPYHHETHCGRELVEIPVKNENSAQEDENAEKIMDRFVLHPLMEELSPMKTFGSVS